MLMVQHLPGDYGLIVDRREDYSLRPVQVFQFLNQWAPLQAIAIVVHRHHSKTVAEIDKALSRKPLKIVGSLAQAQDWINEQLAPVPVVE